MTKTGCILICTALVGFITCGCTGAVSSCQRIYNECESKITAEEDDFVRDCVEEYFDEEGDCQDAVRDFARCVRDNGCDDPDCTDDYWEIGLDCGLDALQIALGK